MSNKIVIDTNVWFKYAAFSKLENLINVIYQYDLQVYINGQILHELHRALSRPKVFNKGKADPDKAIETVKFVSTMVHTHNRFVISPDPKDNFLFDIATQYNCSVLATDENKLLEMMKPPVLIKNILWFKNRFPLNI